MGADLYIESINKLAKKKYRPEFDRAVAARNAEKDKAKREFLQDEVDKYYRLMFSVEAGYFRDAYNGAGLAAKLGFSWWNDVIPMLDDDGMLQPDKIKEFLNRVAQAEVKFQTADDLKAKHCKVDDGENSPEAWHQSVLEHKQELVAFLGMALDRNEAVYCSL